MKKTVMIVSVAALLFTLAPAAQAELIIYVDENSGTNTVDFAWSGIIGNSGTDIGVAPFGGSADQIVPQGTFQTGDRTRADVDDTGGGSWTGSSLYSGSISAFGDLSSPGTSTFLVTSNTPFTLRASGGTLTVGFINDNGTGVPDLSTHVFTGSFSLPGTFASNKMFTGANTLPTTLWEANNFNAGTGDGGSIVFQAVPEPATMSLLAIGGLALLRRRKRA